MVNRLLVTVVLLPIGIGIIAIGGLPFALIATLIMGLAAWEYNRLSRMAGHCPSAWVLIGGTAAFGLSRAASDFRVDAAVLSLVVLLAMTVHLVSYEQGRDRAATDFGVTLGGLVYLGWLGAYLISLRFLPDGMWWILTVLPAVWLCDAGAMLFGIRFGRHRLSPRLSPRKTWEGYFGGLLLGTLGGALLAGLWNLAAPALTFQRGALLGFVLSALTPLGDLGESMIKRQVGAKDSSQLIPGHGGVLDRVDSWLWAGVISYYLITILW